jgi:hypothetical protein
MAASSVPRAVNNNKEEPRGNAPRTIMRMVIVRL